MGVKIDANKNNSSNVSNETIIEYSLLMKQLSEDEINFIKDRNPVKFYKKGTILLKEGEYSDLCYYNFEGCVRQYYIIDGVEKTTFFYTEGYPISPLTTTSKNTPSSYYLECIEDCHLSVTTRTSEQELYKKFPRLESMCRKETERELGRYQEMLASYITTSPEERYLKLLKERPDLLNRVPQHQIASYLGVKPESLSRIRKRLSSKQ